MIAVDLDLGILGGAGSAEEQDFVAFAEDEEIGDAIFQRLGVERRPG